MDFFLDCQTPRLPSENQTSNLPAEYEESSAQNRQFHSPRPDILNQSENAHDPSARSYLASLEKRQMQYQPMYSLPRDPQQCSSLHFHQGQV
ncbi:hypothetical protein N7507_000942 [Penicillium longicatenatum]|nr:hypothetical protein N7507_000942 [Penicillium longicatenatum]